MGELLLVIWVWAFASVIARLVWKAAACEALEDIGVEPPSRWWMNELRGTLEAIDANRARLPKGGTNLYRIGVVVSASVILSVVAAVLLLLGVFFRYRHTLSGSAPRPWL